MTEYPFILASLTGLQQSEALRNLLNTSISTEGESRAPRRQRHMSTVDTEPSRSEELQVLKWQQQDRWTRVSRLPGMAGRPMPTTR